VSFPECFDARLAGMLMRATRRWLGIAARYQEPFLAFIHRFV
jgi:hypothetical protein